VAKYTALEQSNEDSSQRGSHSKERTARILAVIERAQALISDNPGQLLRVLDVMKPWMETVASGRPYVFQ